MAKRICGAQLTHTLVTPLNHCTETIFTCELDPHASGDHSARDYSWPFDVTETTVHAKAAPRTPARPVRRGRADAWDRQAQRNPGARPKRPR